MCTISNLFFQYIDTKVRHEHWKTPNSVIFISKVSNSISEWLKGPTLWREKYFCLWSTVPQTLTWGVFFQEKLIFFSAIFFCKMLKKILFIENGDVGVYFISYIYSKCLKRKAVDFAFFSSFVSPLTSEMFFFDLQFIFWELLIFPFFSRKKSKIFWPALCISF